MRLPNGFGSVHKLSGKRRNPWRARKLDGYDEEGKAIYINLGCYKTRAEGLQALSDFNDDPYSIDAATITFKAVYDKWRLSTPYKKLSKKRKNNYRAAFNNCKTLHAKKMREIKSIDIEGTIKAIPTEWGKETAKTLCNKLFEFSLKHEIVKKNYAKLSDVEINIQPSTMHKPFTPEEIQTLWDNINIPFADMVLAAIYGGWRPQEIAILKTADTDIDNLAIEGGMKSEAGRNRIVPVHNKIIGIIKNRYNPKNEYLFTDPTAKIADHMNYNKYKYRFNKVMKALGMDHTPHDTRHTFVTMAKEADLDEYCIKLIVGHAIEDVTEKVYTHRRVETLRREINKIK